MKIFVKSNRVASMTSGEVSTVVLKGEYLGFMTHRRCTESKGNYQKFKTTNVTLKIQLE